jgi:hypothetical protein
MNTLDSQGQRLLGVLVNHLEKIEPGNPATYIGYKDIHDLLGLKQIRNSWGESLKPQGLSSLADWTAAEGKPGITGIIIDHGTFMPGKGYFRLFGKSEDDFTWWKEQVRLSKEFDWSPYLPIKVPKETPKASDINEPAERQETKIYRILRDTNLSKKVKAIHQFKCQVCGYIIVLPDGSKYSEAHHIRPLGTPHNGPDTMDNIICLCPNHHAEMDYGVCKLELEKLSIAPSHSISADHVRYHNENIYMKRS